MPELGAGRRVESDEVALSFLYVQSVAGYNLYHSFNSILTKYYLLKVHQLP